MSALARTLCLTLLLALAAEPRASIAADGGGIELERVRMSTADGVYLLDATADIRLTDAVSQALDNGVMLTFAWDVRITRERAWWPDAVAAEVTQRYSIELHELSLQYLVTNQNTGERRSYARRRAALASIGMLRDLPVVDTMLIEDRARHQGHVRLVLEHNSLPLPLRPQILFNADWYLDSDWRSWSFE